MKQTPARTDRPSWKHQPQATRVRRRWATACLVTLAAVFSCARARADIGLNVFGDLNYSLQRQADTTTNSFSVPRLDLFYSTAIDRLSFLAEVMLEVGDNNEFGPDVERIEVAYLFSEWLRVRAGRFHTALGYYNDAFHHGRYFQVASDRPESVRFEDEGGLLPAHSVGVHADGRVPLGGAGSLRYDIELANGRGSTSDEVTNKFDPNNEKAFDARLRFEPRFLDGLIAGANVYLDTISAATMAMPPALPISKVDERIWGAHLVYLEHGVHFIGELNRIEHRDALGLGVTTVGFVETGYVFSLLTPYARYERAVFPARLDAFWATNELATRGNFDALTLGVRYLASEYLAFKVEGGHDFLHGRPDENQFVVQCAFAF